MNFGNLRIRTRFVLLIALFVFGFAVCAGWSFKTIAELKVNGPIYQRIVQSKDLIADILPPPAYIIESYLVTLQLAEERESAAQNKLAQRLAALQKEYDGRHAFWSREALEPELANAFLKDAHVHASSFYAIASRDFLPAVRNNDREAMDKALKRMASAYDAHRQGIDRVVEMAGKRAGTDEARAKDRIASAHLQLVAILILSLGAAVSFAALIIRSISRPLIEAVQVAKTVASGDLTTTIDVRHSDETGQLLQALKDMNDSLARIVGEVRAGTDSMMHVSKRIAVSNLDLSSRTDEQASSLQETASSMEQLTSTVKQNADNASQANAVAASASNVAMEGGAFVSQVFQTMRAINDSAKKVVDIIGVINGIAFQTNILALNAAVEAARAGDQGRGFAVVASEVRNLAQRSAAAAKEIEALISDSVEKIDAGMKLVDQAGSTMEEIVSGVRKVSDIVGEIAAASKEQTDGIEQINAAVVRMDDTTQLNASMAEEATAAASSLQEQAENLFRAVSVFRLA